MSRPVTDAAVARLQAIVGPSVASSDLRAALFRCRGDENRALDRVLSVPPRAAKAAGGAGAGGRPRSGLLVARRAATAAAAAAAAPATAPPAPAPSPNAMRPLPSTPAVPLGRPARRWEPTATPPPPPAPAPPAAGLESTTGVGGATPPVPPPPAAATPPASLIAGGTPAPGGSTATPLPAAPAAAAAGGAMLNDTTPPASTDPKSASSTTVSAPATAATAAAGADRTAWHAFFRHYYAAAYERMSTTTRGVPDKRVVNKILARWWRTLSPADRAVWVDAGAEAVRKGGARAVAAVPSSALAGVGGVTGAAAASAGSAPLPSPLSNPPSEEAGSCAPSSPFRASRTMQTARRNPVVRASSFVPTILPPPAAGATARPGWPKVLPPAAVTGMCTSSCRALTVGEEVTFSVGGLERAAGDGGVRGRGRGRPRGGTAGGGTPGRGSGTHAPLNAPPPLPSSSAAIVRFSVRGSVVGKLPAAVAQPLGLLLTVGLVSVHGVTVAAIPPCGGVRFGGRLEMHLSLALHRLAFPAAVGGGVGVAAAAAEAAAATVVGTGAGPGGGSGGGGGKGGGGEGGGGDAVAWQGVLVRLLGALGLVDTRGYEGATPSPGAPTAAADETADAPGTVAEGDRENFYDTVEQLTSGTGGDGAGGGGDAPPRPAALSSAATLARPPRGLTATLRPYQAAGVAWMVARERYGDNATAVAGGNDGDCNGDDDSDGDCGAVAAVADASMARRGVRGGGARRRLRLHPLWHAYSTADGTPFYVNATSGVVSLDMPAANPDGVRGGIMADEMGLGKTVMTIATILANRVLGADGEAFDGVAEEEAEAAAAAAAAAGATVASADGDVKVDECAAGGDVKAEAGSVEDGPQVAGASEMASSACGDAKVEAGPTADPTHKAAAAAAAAAGAAGGGAKVEAALSADVLAESTTAVKALRGGEADVPAAAASATGPMVGEPGAAISAVVDSPGAPPGDEIAAMDVDAVQMAAEAPVAAAAALLPAVDDGGDAAAKESSPSPTATAVVAAAVPPSTAATPPRSATPDVAAAAASPAAARRSPPAVGAKRRRVGTADAPVSAASAAATPRRRPRRAAAAAAATRGGRPTYADVPSSESDSPTSLDSDADGSDGGRGWTPSSANGLHDGPSSAAAAATAASVAAVVSGTEGESEASSPLSRPQGAVLAKRARTGRATRSSTRRTAAASESDSEEGDAADVTVLADTSGDSSDDGGGDDGRRPRWVTAARARRPSRQGGGGGAGGGGMSLGVGGLLPPHARSRRRGGTLVVCPLSLLAQWVDELAEHVAPGVLRVVTYYGAKRGARGAEAISLAAADVVVTTYQTLAAEAPLASADGGGGDGGGGGGGNGGGWAGRSEAAAGGGVAATHAHPPPPLYCVTWTRVVLDEAHTIKSSATRAARAAYLLRASRRWALTGTPIVNALDDVQSLLRYLQAAPWSEPAVWRSRIVEPLASGGGGGVAAAQATVRRVLRPLMLRRRKSTVDAAGRPIVELPPKDISVLSVALSPAERDFYDALYLRSKTRFDAFVAAGRVFNNYASVLEILLRLRQCCDHPYLVLAAPSKDLAAWKDMNKLAARFVDGGAGGGGDGSGGGGGDAARERFVRSVLAASRPSPPVGGDAAAVTDGAGGVGRPSPSSLSGTPPPGTTPLPATAAAPCPICLDGVEDAVLPPCCHALCRACAAEQLAAAGGGADATAPCALCRAPWGRADLTTAPRSSRWAVDVDARWVPSAKITAALAALRAHASTPGAGKAVLFSQWTSCLDLVEVALRKDAEAAAAAGEPPLPSAVRLDGSCSAAARAATLSAFGDPRPGTPGLLLVSLKAGGTGLNLTAANLVLLLDPWWNWAVEAQAVDRACRIGQTRPVRVLRLVVADSVEERMLRVQERKSALVDGAMGSAEERRAARLEDVMMLFS